jgi:hypothetical protein
VRETSPGEALEARLNQEMTRLRRVPANHQKSDDELVKLAHDALYGNNSVENIAACHSAQLEPTINLTSSYAGCAQWAPMFHNIRWAHFMCSRKAKMSALSKVEMSVSAPFREFGGCHFDGHGVDEQARTEPS